MKTAVLFSGGKDSTLALDYALRYSKVKCLIGIASENPESFMFHTPSIEFVEKQAECAGLPLILQKTKGVKEKELKDLKAAILKAKKKFKIEGIVTGALASTYQSSRIQAICNSANLECFNPLWQKGQFELLEELQNRKIIAIIGGVFAQGLENFVGKRIDQKFIAEIKPLVEKYSINPAGEGGEFESFVLDAPFFKKKLVIEDCRIVEAGHGSRILKIEKLKVVKK
ncbi:MAG: diphthine--ammonia ligase [Candidatus Diapherotrites archaeon]|nr:diphthine--ammonia ligase [Candidatus Diapherotrites archaeon]